MLGLEYFTGFVFTINRVLMKLFKTANIYVNVSAQKTVDCSLNTFLCVSNCHLCSLRNVFGSDIFYSCNSHTHTMSGKRNQHIVHNFDQ